MKLNEKHQFSVIIPAYNAQESIERCVNSILGKASCKIQIIIIDDGSQDATLSICRQMAQRDERILVLTQPNSGPGRARENGLRHAEGAYISFVDSDDYVEPDTFNILAKAIAETAYDIVEFGYRFVYEDKDDIRDFSLKPGVLTGVDCLAAFVTHSNTTNYLCNKIFKRHLFEGLQHAHLYAGEDAFLLAQLHRDAANKRTLEDILYYYVQTSNSLCRAPFNVRKLDNIQADKLILSLLEERYPKLHAQYAYVAAAHCVLLHAEIADSSLPNRLSVQKELRDLFKDYMRISRKADNHHASAKRRLSVALFALSPSLHRFLHNRLKT